MSARPRANSSRSESVKERQLPSPKPAARNHRQDASRLEQHSRNFISRIFQVLLVGLLILAASPFFVGIAVAIKVTAGSPVLYRGKRLGLKKQSFTMYKFRTLAVGAEEILGSELFTRRLAADTALEHGLGKFLRDTRLDELPQLFNVLKGDMNFIGPRPLRPAVYEKWCQVIANYDHRFEVKPGLIGFSQVITPHNSPKRIRSLIDNRFIDHPAGLKGSIGLVLLVIYGVIHRTASGIFVYLANRLKTSLLFGRHGEHRRHERVHERHVVVCFQDGCIPDPALAMDGRMIEISPEAMVIYTDETLPEEGDFEFGLATIAYQFPGRAPKRKIAYCRGTVIRHWIVEDEGHHNGYAVWYTPISPLNDYMIHQYFLHESIA